MTGRCATCKWAEPEVRFAEQRVRCANPTLKAEAWNEVDAYIYVKPDFGCVQWEAREEA